MLTPAAERERSADKGRAERPAELTVEEARSTVTREMTR